tara:strand:+ start:221 stop:808 length:588 start_codon:yes stop_codon:yes gene_type:complete
MSKDLLDFSDVFNTLNWDPNQDQTVWRVLFLFYIAVAGNYIGGLFNKKVVHLFENDLTTMHVLGFLIMMVSLGKNTIVESVKYTAVFYLLFELSTRMHYKLLFIFLAVLAIEYFVENRLKILDEKIKTGNANEEELEEFRQHKIASEWLSKIAFGLIVVGLFHAAYEFSLHHDDFSMKGFLLDQFEFQHELKENI